VLSSIASLLIIGALASNCGEGATDRPSDCTTTEYFEEGQRRCLPCPSLEAPAICRADEGLFRRDRTEGDTRTGIDECPILDCVACSTLGLTVDPATGLCACPPGRLSEISCGCPVGTQREEFEGGAFECVEAPDPLPEDMSSLDMSAPEDDMSASDMGLDMPQDMQVEDMAPSDMSQEDMASGDMSADDMSDEDMGDEDMDPSDMSSEDMDTDME